jgi:hypothetical protein
MGESSVTDSNRTPPFSPIKRPEDRKIAKGHGRTIAHAFFMSYLSYKELLGVGL